MISWSIIWILFTLVLEEGCSARQVDKDHAFAQTELTETLFEESPKLFATKLKYTLC